MFKALADPTRRFLLDLSSGEGRTLAELETGSTLASQRSSRRTVVSRRQPWRTSAKKSATTAATAAGSCSGPKWLR